MPRPILIVSFLVALAAGCPTRAPDRPDILLISLDTTRRDHLSVYGYGRETTPRLEELAAESLVFDRCVAVSNWTLPTHASMLTGVLPPTHGAHFVGRDRPFVEHVEPAAALDPDRATLAEVLRAAGWRTGAVLANWWWLGDRYGLHRGFDDYDHRRGEPPTVYRRAETITDEAIAWLAAAEDDDRPFFLFLNYMDPHIPYAPPPPYDKRFGEHPPVSPVAESWQFWVRAQKDVIRSGLPFDPGSLEFLVDRYDGELAYMDAQIGRLFDRLRETDRWERTLVLVTSDHGEAFGEHGIAGHGVALYEPELAVPLIVRLPGGARSGRVDVGVQHQDVLPTVLDVAGIPVPPEVQGVSVLSPQERDLLALEFPREATVRLRPEFDRTQWALYRGNWKLIDYSSGESELYDLARDPRELRDLGEESPDVRSELRAALERLRSEIPLPAPREAETPELDPETLESLRSLGYVN